MSTNASGYAIVGGTDDAGAGEVTSGAVDEGNRPRDESILDQQNAIRAESSSVPYVGPVEELMSLKSGVWQRKHSSMARVLTLPCAIPMQAQAFSHRKGAAIPAFGLP